VANALIALDVHEQVLTNVAGSVEKILDEIRRIPEHAKAFEGTRRAEFRRAADETLAALKRDARTLVDISKQDPDHVGTLVLAGAADTLVHVLLTAGEDGRRLARLRRRSSPSWGTPPARAPPRRRRATRSR